MGNYTETFGALPPKKDIREYKASCSKRASAVNIPEEFELPMCAVKNQGSVGSCHDRETEVLTRQGWKLFKDITKDDLLASVNPETNTIIFEHPTNIISYKYTGNLICGKHTSLDFKVTPNHRMLVRPRNEQTRKLDSCYKFIEASELGCYCGLMSTFNYEGSIGLSDDECIVFPKEKLVNGNILPELKINLHDWVQFIGIYLAEGTLCTDPIVYHYRIQLAAVKDREVNYIHDLLQRMGIIACNHKKDRFVFSNKRIWNKLASYGLHGVKAKDKFVPDFIFDLDSAYINDFLLGFGMGDGHKAANRKWQYFTSSPKLAEQLQILVLLAGNLNKISVHAPRAAGFKSHIVLAENVSPSYTISTRTQNLSITRKQNIFEEPYDDYVYCAEVPTYHTLITRRNGNILVSGNCVAHSVAEMIEYFNKVQEGTNVVFSTGYIYGNRKNCSYTGAGMYVDKALGVVQKWGDVPNSLFNYNIEVPDAITKFEEKAFDLAPEAYEHRITEYFSLTTDEARKLNLMQNGPIVFSIPWYKGYKVDSDGVLRHTSEEVSGHHAMVIYGWNKKGWKFQNSWGTGFGTRGRAILPYDIKFGTCYGIKDENSKKAIADKIAELQKKIAELETTLSNKATVIKDYEAKISKLTLQLNSLTVNKDRLEQQVEELKKDTNAKADEIKNLEAIIKDLKENNMAELVEKIKVLQQEKKAALNEIDKLKENVEELTKKNTELELMNEELLEIHKPFKNIPTWLAHVINAIINVFVKKK